MSVLDCARIIVYRINKKGLEVFLVHSGLDSGKEEWSLPQGVLKGSNCNDCLEKEFQIIELDPVQKLSGDLEGALALEGDWHDIPSIRGIIKDDVRIIKTQLKQKFPELEQGAFVAFKEVFKKVLPEEYAFLKELKDVIQDKNMASSI